MKKEYLVSKYPFTSLAIKQLDGYCNRNFRIESTEGNFILKVYPNEKETIDLVLAENDILLFLNTKNPEVFPVPVKNIKGSFLTASPGNKEKYRVLTFLEGEFLAQTKHTPALFQSLGHFLAETDLYLQNHRNYVIEARKHEWDLNCFQDFIPQKTKYIGDPSQRKIVDYFIQQHRQNVVPVLPSLRKSIIHNDANDRNVLIRNGKVSGIIDFGDLCHSPLINELAIAITYAVMGKADPVKWALPVIYGYHQALPLQEKEIDLLYWLIAARLCTSVCKSAEEKIRQPDNPYISISEKPAWALLHKWAQISPVFIRNAFRKATGFPVLPVKTVEQMKSERLRSVSSTFSVSYRKPVYMDRGAFQYMFDKYGVRHLDAYNNIPHVGHSHPHVAEAAQKQLTRLNTNTRYLYDGLNEYTTRLLDYFPSPLRKVFLVNSGSAATDLALRLARNYTGRRKTAVLEHGYHGNTAAGIDVSHYKFSNPGGTGVPKNTICLPLPDTYRGKFKNNDANAGFSYAQEALRIIEPWKGKIASFIAEPIVGCGGQVPVPKDYLKILYPEIRQQGGICISDEVQTGFGRLGDVFWGFEAHEVIPDIVILGKPMGNGHPMGAVVCTDAIAEAFENGMEFFSSFGGNPVSCSIGQAVLEVLETEHLQKNALTVGNDYLQKLRELANQYECIGDVRGSGLFIGIELVKDRLSQEPHTRLARHLKNELRNHRILVSTDGPYENVIKSKPPLCFSKENVDEVVGALAKILNT